MPDDVYADIREALPVTGRTIVAVTADDWHEVCERYPDPESRVSHVYFHLDDGMTLSIPVTCESGIGYGEDLVTR